MQPLRASERAARGARVGDMRAARRGAGAAAAWYASGTRAPA